MSESNTPRTDAAARAQGPLVENLANCCASLELESNMLLEALEACYLCMPKHERHGAYGMKFLNIINNAKKARES
jgi:hypothetical protein